MRAGWSPAEIVRATAVAGGTLPRIDFAAEAEPCPSCNGVLRVQKSRRRTVITLSEGAFAAREIRKHCENRSCPSTRSDALRRLVKPGQRYGYDLVVHVGLGRYLAGQQREEIRRRLLAERGIELSAGTVSALCDRFLSLFEALHVARAPQLRAAQPGGYPLHIDATCEHGKGGLFVCMDGWRGWALWAARVPTENAVYLTPAVDRTVELFGQPIAVMRDMGDGGALAVDALRKAGVPDLICHYHFAAAVGGKLFDKLYDALRGILRLSHIRTELWTLLRELRHCDGSSSATEGRYGLGCVRDELKALILWVLEGDGRKNPPYPFALPHLEFVRRCRQAAERAERWAPCPRTQPERRALAVLARRVGHLERDPRLAETVESIEERWRTFSELRDVLRLSNADLPRGDTRLEPRQLPTLELLRLEQIKQAVESFEAELRGRIPPAERGKSRPSSAPAIVLKYIERNRVHLFGHPARFDPDGRVVAVVDRTNNVIEHFFGQDKQRLRRRVGRAHLCQDLEQQPAQAVLVANLRHADYVQALCGSLEQLPAALAMVGMESATALSPPVRQQRDKHLKQRVRKLLATTESTLALPADQAEPQRCSALEPVDFSSRWPDLASLSEDDVRVRCVGMFASPEKSAPKKPSAPRLPPPGTVLTPATDHPPLHRRQRSASVSAAVATES